MAAKPKVLSISKLKQKAWSIFSKWIRTRDIWTCYTCGKRMENSPAMHAGHFISRRHSATMFDEMNVHAQCMYCNMWDYGNSGVYAMNLIRDYGKEEFDKLVLRGKTTYQFSRQELEDIMVKYAL